jgi:glycosyltransferase involved in cell wall biosynthesis
MRAVAAVSGEACRKKPYVKTGRSNKIAAITLQRTRELPDGNERFMDPRDNSAERLRRHPTMVVSDRCVRRAAPLMPATHDATELRVARVIGRLNIGGPAVQAILLTRAMQEHGFRTELIRGSEGSEEGNMDHLAAELGVRPIRIKPMRRDVGWRDVPALYLLWRQLREFRPHIVHTEAAKAGTLGRLSALLTPRRERPVVVHTFHGHSLEGYFSARKASLFLAIERFLAQRSDLLIAVSSEVKADLVRLGVAEEGKITVVPVGLDLRAFVVSDQERRTRRAAKRANWGVGADETVVTLIARLVPIKRVDRFLRIASLLAERDAQIRFVVVGGGEQRTELMSSPAAHALGTRVVWTGFERNMPDVCFASDVVVLTSDNEGTPMSFIEAQAAGVPVVGTRVGGMATAVRDGRSGYLVEADDALAFADAVAAAFLRREELGVAGRADVLSRFSAERLAGDLAKLYRELCGARLPHR